MAFLNSTIINGKLAVNGGISENGTLLSAKYAPISHTHSQYLTSHQSLAGYATETWVGDNYQPKGTYLTSHQSLSGYATETWVGNNYQPKGSYLTSHQDISGKVDKTTDGVNVALNLLSEGTSNPQDDDYYISQYAGGGTTTTTYHRRPVSKLYNYIKGKLDSVYQPKGSYLTSHQSLSGYATETWVGNNYQPKGSYLTSHQSLSGYATETWVNNKGYIQNAGSSPNMKNGTTITQPGGTNAISIKTPGSTSDSDTGIFYLSDDSAYICNSSDSAYTFAVFDKDKGTDFSSADKAAFVVKSDHAGVGMKGNLSVAGSITATNVYASSDRRLKENIITPSINYLNIINSLHIKEFNFKTQKDKENKFLGLIAQETLKVLPEPYKHNIVSGSAKKNGEHLSINEGKIQYITMGAVQQLSKKCDKLEKENKKLKDKVSSLEKDLKRIKKLLNMD